MAPIKMEFGQVRIERKALSLTRAEKDRILQNFADKITVAVPNFGTQEFPLRAYVKSFLDQVQLPSVKVVFEVHGSCDDVEAVEIEATNLQVIGTRAGSFSIADTHVSYEFGAQIGADAVSIAPCTCEEGHEGQQMSRTFRIAWLIDIDLEPGVAGTYEIEEFDITVAAPCCCPPVDVIDHEDDEEDDDDDDGDDDDKSGKVRKKLKKKGKGKSR